MIADATGKSVVVEFIDGELKPTTTNENWQVCTNHEICGKSEARTTASCSRYQAASNELADMHGDVSPNDVMKVMQSVENRIRRCGRAFTTYRPANSISRIGGNTRSRFGDRLDLTNIRLRIACRPNAHEWFYIRSTTSMPSRFSPRSSVRAVRSHSSSRLVRSSSVSALQHRAVLEEIAVARGQFEQVGREVVRPIVGDDAVEGFGELKQRDGEGALLRRGEQMIADCRRSADCGFESTPPFAKMLLTRA